MAEATGFVCPHCSSVNPQLSEFCPACGMAMPSMTPSGPRVVGGRGFATTSAGQKLQSDELRRTAIRAARSLRTIGIIYLALGSFSAFMVYNLFQLGRTTQTKSMLFLELSAVSTVVVGAIYLGMFFWAKYNPLTATIVGLVVYLLKWGLDIGMQLTLLKSSNTQNSIANYGIFRLIMVFYLITGVVAAVKHRKLELEQSQAGAPLPVLPAE